MTEKELSVVLRETARMQKKPLCDEWYGNWTEDAGIDSLLDKFVRGQDFCIENDYPTLDFIRSNFDKEDLRRHNIYLDEELDLRDLRDGTFILLGECRGSMQFGGFGVASVYIRHRSEVTVHAKDLAKVFVSVYDEGGGSTECDNGATVKVYNRRKKEDGK